MIKKPVPVIPQMISRTALAVALCMTPLLPQPLAARTVGINAAIKNQVQTRKVNTTNLQPAKLKGRVAIGDFIRTGNNGVLQILLRDRTYFTVGKKGQVTIDRFVYDPSSNASEVAASVTRGAFRMISGKPTRNRKGRSAVRTPVGSIGIRGTIFEGAVGPDAIAVAKWEAIDQNAVAGSDDDATLVVLRGPGANTQGDEISGAVDLTTEDKVYPLEQAGSAYFVPNRNAVPIGPFPISQAGLALLQDLLRTSPDQPSQVNTAATASEASASNRPSIDRDFEVIDGSSDNDFGQFEGIDNGFGSVDPNQGQITAPPPNQQTPTPPFTPTPSTSGPLGEIP